MDMSLARALEINAICCEASAAYEITYAHIHDSSPTTNQYDDVAIDQGNAAANRVFSDRNYVCNIDEMLAMERIMHIYTLAR